MPKTDVFHEGQDAHPDQDVRPDYLPDKVVTVGEVFTFNHYPERLSQDEKVRIENKFLNTDTLVASHKRRMKRDGERNTALKAFVARSKT